MRLVWLQWLLLSLLATSVVVAGGLIADIGPAPVQSSKPAVVETPSVPVSPSASDPVSPSTSTGSPSAGIEDPEKTAFERALVVEIAQAEAKAAAREKAARKVARQAAAAEARRVAQRKARRAARAAVLAAPLNVSVVHANIPNRSSEAGYRATLAAMVARNPDFIGLNEQSGRTIEFIESAAPGYSAYRDPSATPDANSMANVVLWKTDKFTLLDAGRIQLVVDDHTVYKHKPVVWDRFATWARFERTADRVPMSVVATHMMLNPSKFGPNMPARQAQYGRGMDTLVGQIRRLEEFGPVLVTADMNTHANQEPLPWSAAAKMRAAGFDFTNNAVDFIFYPQDVRLVLEEQAYGPTPEPDHRWLYARFQ